MNFENPGSDERELTFHPFKRFHNIASQTSELLNSDNDDLNWWVSFHGRMFDWHVSNSKRCLEIAVRYFVGNLALLPNMSENISGPQHYVYLCD